MTQGHQRLKASPLSPCSSPRLEGFGDFLWPPTRQTDVERSPVPRAANTNACCFPPADGAYCSDSSDTVTHQIAEASQVQGSNLLCLSAVKRVCQLTGQGEKQPLPSVSLYVHFIGMERDLRRGDAFSSSTAIKSSGCQNHLNTCSLLGLLVPRLRVLPM